MVTIPLSSYATNYKESINYKLYQPINASQL